MWIAIKFKYLVHIVILINFNNDDLEVMPVDERFVLFPLRRMLVQNGVVVDVETDPIKAIDKIKNENYKLVVSDFRLPVLDVGKFFELVEDISLKKKIYGTWSQTEV